MGHGGFIKTEYEAYLRRLETGITALPMPDHPAARAAWQDVLEILLTPEQASLAACVSPTRRLTAEEVARRAGLPLDDTRRRLEALADRGIVFDFVNPRTGAVKWLLAPAAPGMLDFPMKRLGDDDGVPKARLARSIEAYFHGDDAFLKELIGDTPFFRTLVNEEALEPGDLAEVVDWERSTAIVEGASKIAVSPCTCRHRAEHFGRRCDAPLDTCLALGGGARFAIRRRFGREIEKPEALEILARSREHGLVQMLDNVRGHPTFLCNCCSCCCDVLRLLNDYGLPSVIPSGFEARADADRCAGCGTCVAACPVRAISESDDGAAPTIDAGRCIGCGLCAAACPQAATAMVRRAAPPHVPANVIERTVNRMIERGRLPHLLYDEGASRGARFMNLILRAICALPPAQQALASRQLRSRFVDFVIRTRSRPRSRKTPS